MTASGLVLRVGDRRVPVQLPSLADPRLRVAMVLMSVQVLGQVALGFELSIAQILVSLAAAATIEIGVVLWRKRVLAWPASALLTGSGVALLLRVPGTEHGDWWSLRGWWIYASVAALALASKYLIHPGGRPLFNPSNLGLVLCFLVLGSDRVDPQDLWWGPMSVGVAIATVLIVVGGLLVGRRLGLLGVAMSFYATFVVGMSLLAVSGHCMTSRWHMGPVCGMTFWTVLVTSPEVLIFVLFMITDPRTVPEARVARVVFGCTIGVLASTLVALQHTEYATKTVLLLSLTLACAARPLLERSLPAVGSSTDHVGRWFASPAPGRPGGRAAAPTVFAAGLVVIVLASVLSPSPSSLGGPLPADAASASSLPPVRIDPAVRRAVSGMDERRAQAMAIALIADLRDEAEAVRTTSLSLARTAVTQRRLVEARAAIRRVTPGDPVTVQSYRFSELRIVLAGGRAGPQSLPQLGVLARGTVTQVTWYGGKITRKSAATPVRATFLLVQSKDGFLLAGDDQHGALPAVTNPTVKWTDVARNLPPNQPYDGGSQPGQPPLFADATDQAGVRISTESMKLNDLPEPTPGYWSRASTWDLLLFGNTYWATGQAWGDVDGDGRLDLFLTDQTGSNHLFLNQGSGRFTPAPEELAGPLRLTGQRSGGAEFVDYDNSGWPSLLLLTATGTRLFHNDHGHRFVEVTRSSGLVTSGRAETAAWADVNNDGRLDVYITSYGCNPCGLANRPPFNLGQGKLFLNEGNGRFDDRTDLVSHLPGVNALGLSALWLDANGDGRPDLYLANDVRSLNTVTDDGGGAPGNVLIMNDGPGCGGWCFSDAGSASGANRRALTMGVASGDFSGTGRPDLLYTNGGFVEGPATLLRNDNGTFADVSAEQGANLGEFSWGVSPLDVDNDGHLDAFVSVGISDAVQMLPVGDLSPKGYPDVRAQRAAILNGATKVPPEAYRPPWPIAADAEPRTNVSRVLLQGPDRRFSVVDVGATDVVAPSQYGNAVGDYDNDGWPDVVVGTFDNGYTLLRNRQAVGAGNHGVGIVLQGDGQRVNRQAVGARVVVHDTAGGLHTGWVQIGGGLGGGSDVRLMFGLGTAGVSSVDVTWPDGTTATYPVTATDAYVKIDYGSTTVDARPFGTDVTFTSR